MGTVILEIPCSRSWIFPHVHFPCSATVCFKYTGNMCVLFGQVLLNALLHLFAYSRPIDPPPSSLKKMLALTECIYIHPGCWMKTIFWSKPNIWTWFTIGHELKGIIGAFCNKRWNVKQILCCVWAKLKEIWNNFICAIMQNFAVSGLELTWKQTVYLIKNSLILVFYFDTSLFCV